MRAVEDIIIVVYYFFFIFLAHSKNELTQWRGVRRLSVCKLLRKWLLVARKWPDRDQTCTGWSLQVSLHTGCSQGQGRG